MKSESGVQLTPPSWMKKAEKTTFRRLIQARSDAGRPVQSIEFDALCDLVAARSRLDDLRDMLPEAPFPSDKLAVLRQIEATTSTARRLSKDLHLTSQRA